MATIPTPEESARKILSIYVNHFNCRPGHTLASNNLMVCQDYGLSVDDQDRGMEYAIQQGWIEFTQNRDFRLIDKGFAEA